MVKLTDSMCVVLGGVWVISMHFHTMAEHVGWARYSSQPTTHAYTRQYVKYSNTVDAS